MQSTIGQKQAALEVQVPACPCHLNTIRLFLKIDSQTYSSRTLSQTKVMLKTFEREMLGQEEHSIGRYK
jgi:hypothetical protein